MDIISKIPLFSCLSSEECGRFEKQLVMKQYQENELILDFEDESRDVLFILSGKVRVLYRSVQGREVIIADLGPKDFFGELSAIDEQGRSANVTALQRSDLAIMPHGLFLQLATGVPEVAHLLLQTLVGRIRALDKRFSEMSVLKTNERLYAELLRLSTPRRSRPGERIISPPPYHHHLAGRIGCRREVVSRELSRLMQADIVEKSRGGLVIKNVSELETRIAQALN